MEEKLNIYTLKFKTDFNATLLLSDEIHIVGSVR